MGEDSVSPSHQKCTTYTELFDAVFPYYLSIGMTYDQFWNEDGSLAKYYREARRLNNLRENQAMWMQGLYIREALVSTVGNMFRKKGAHLHDYPHEPFLIEGPGDDEAQKETERKQMQAGKDHMERLMSAINAKMGVNADGGTN